MFIDLTFIVSSCSIEKNAAYGKNSITIVYEFEQVQKRVCEEDRGARKWLEVGFVANKGIRLLHLKLLENQAVIFLKCAVASLC